METKFKMSKTASWLRNIGISWWHHKELGEWRLTLGLWFFEFTITKEDQSYPF